MKKELISSFYNDYTKEFICLHDPTGAYNSVSDSAFRIIGYTQEELIGTNIYNYIHEEEREFFEMVVHLPIINGSQNLLNVDLRFKKRDGNYVWLNMDVVPVKNEKDIIIGLVTISRDISELIVIKNKYENKQALLSSTGQMAQLGPWEYEVNNKTLTWSKETYDIYELKEFSTPDFESTFKFFPGESSDIVKSAVRNAIEHGIAFDLTVPFITAKGNKIWVRVMATPKIHLGKVIKLYGLIQNIDREINANLVLKSMVKQLTKQNRQLEDFTHILSHNVRGPIASLSTLLVMLETAENDNEKKEIMDMLKMSSKSLEDLLVELKEVINATYVRGVESQENDILPIINYSTGLLKGEIVKSKATIELNINDWQNINYPKIYLESILINLMSNALKYRAEDRHPVLSISTIVENGQFILKFSDNGCGIDLDKHGANMFKLYKTFHLTKPGKGLGLFMTKSQIEAMGGEINVESRINEGTTFTIIFNKEKIGEIKQPESESMEMSNN